MEKPIWEQQSFQEKLFRFIALLCLVGWGGSAIYIASHVGSMEDAYFRARDLASYFFTAIWIFLFFYAQYRNIASCRALFIAISTAASDCGMPAAAWRC